MIISSVDIGTNTVLLLIAEADLKNNKIIPLLNEYRIPRIGKDVNKTGQITDESILKLKDILLEYIEISLKFNSTRIIAAATAAFRKARNSEKIIDYISATTGIDIKIISGEEEAFFAYTGITDGIKDNQMRMVIDIGGGSTELIFGRNQNILFRKSFDIGVVTLIEQTSLKDGFQKIAEETFKELNSIDLKQAASYGIAGTPTTLAAIKNKMEKFDEGKVDGTKLNIDDINFFINSYSKDSAAYMGRYSEILKGREDLIIPGSIILSTIMNFLKLEEITVSTRGIRHGIIIDFLKNQGCVF